MSASASKKRRQAQDEQGFTQRQIAETKEKAEKKKKRMPIILFCIVAVVAIALVIVLAFFGKSQSDARLAAEMTPDYDVTAPVATVGNESVSVPLYNYFYNQVVNNSAQIAMYFYGLQANIPLADQAYGDGTFEDFFKEQTKTAIQEYMNIYAEAKANGYELTEEDKEAIETSMTGLRDTASQYGYPSTDYYLYRLMGKGCTEENYRDYMTIYQTAAGYVQQVNESLTPSDEEISAAYAEDPAAYDLVHYSSYTVEAEGTEVEVEADEDSEEAHTHTEYTDEAIAKAAADAEAAVASFPTEGTNTSYGNRETLTSRYNAEVAEWLFDSARKEGDVNSFASEDGHSYYVLRYESRDTNDYNRINAYVVAISMSADAASESDLTAAQVVEKITAGMSPDMSDEDFEKLVSDNDYTATSIEVAKDSYNEDIVNYLFSSDRVAGDYQTFQDGDTMYIVRFQSVAEQTYQYELVKDALTTKAQDEWYNSVKEKNEIVIDESMIGFANTNLTLHSAN